MDNIIYWYTENGAGVNIYFRCIA